MYLEERRLNLKVNYCTLYQASVFVNQEIQIELAFQTMLDSLVQFLFRGNAEDNGCRVCCEAG